VDITRKRSTVPKLRGLPASRRGALVLALACAVAAAIILVVAIGNYRKNLVTSNKQDTVLVATAAIQKGTPATVIVDRTLFRPTPVLQHHVSAGAITDAAALQGKYALRDILPGQQLTLADFASTGGVLAQLTPNQRAISISLDASHGITDVLQAGDRVDVYGGYSVQLKGDSQTHPIVRLLVSAALVLKGPGTGAGGGLSGSGGSGTANVVLAIDSQQVGTLAFTSDNGKVWLALRPANATAPAPDVTTINTILTGTRATASGDPRSPKLVFEGTVHP
jgi:Flp pilus assembly protein CpaB